MTSKSRSCSQRGSSGMSSPAATTWVFHDVKVLVPIESVMPGQVAKYRLIDGQCGGLTTTSKSLLLCATRGRRRGRAC